MYTIGVKENYMNDKEAVKTLQLPISVHEDLKALADMEATKLNINHLSKVGYLRRLIAREKAKA